MNQPASGSDSIAAWSQYWSGGRLSSCPGAADSNYSGAIATCWETFFAELPDNCRLLDIACGNGALLALTKAFARAHDQRWQMTGVDRARLEQRSELAAPDIKLCSGVDMHALPYPDASFDAVCSQYGIEYGHFPHNLAAALRVLKPGGQFQFMLHCADSAIAQRARLQLQQIDLLQRDWGLFVLLQNMLQGEGSATAFPATKQNFDRAAASAFAYMKSLRQQQDGSLIEQSLQQLGGIWQMRDQHSSADSIRACKDAVQALQSLRQRLLDQQTAMLDQQQAQGWLTHAHRYATDAQLSPLEDDGYQLGWCLGGSK